MQKKKNFCDNFYDNDFIALFNTSTMNGYSEQRNITMVIHNEIQYKLMKMSFQTDLDKTEVNALLVTLNSLKWAMSWENLFMPYANIRAVWSVSL